MPSAGKASRKLALPRYPSFRLSKRIKQPKTTLTGGFRLFWRTLKVLGKYKRQFGGMLIIATVLHVLLVRGVSNATSLTDLKGVFDGVFTGASGQLSSGAALFAMLVSGSSTTVSEVAAVYQSVLMVLFSIAYIWGLRQVLAAKPYLFGLREPFYKGMYPLIPFLGVLLVIGLQLIPLTAANFLYSTVVAGGLAVTALEQVLWLLLILLLAVLSFYLISSSIFSLYIVTLADVTPMQALRSARELVRFRRWSIIRKLLVLPFCLLLLGAIIIIPLIIVWPAAAEWVFYLLSMAALPVAHGYVYQLYRELL